MTQVLYRKWRPMTFEKVVGQDHVTHTLRNALALGRIGHAYLFSGPRGTGKTTTARLLAKAVDCLEEELAQRPCNACRICRAINEGRFLDLIEIDAASNTGVDDVRDLREKIGFSPNEGRYKVYIIDEVHMLSTAAFNALLKTLEEPPPHAIFVLATTESHKIPATVLSRCQRFEFRRIPLPQIVGRLQELLGYEGVAAEPAALNLIARQATGALRDAESLLDQLLSSQSGDITLQHAQAVLGTARDEEVERVVAAWIAADPPAGLGAIQRAVEAGTEPQQLARQIVDLLRGMMFFKTGGAAPADVPESAQETLRTLSGSLEMAELLDGVRRFSTAVSESKGGWQPQLPLELAFIECVTERGAAAASEAQAAARPEPVEPSPEPAPLPADEVEMPADSPAAPRRVAEKPAPPSGQPRRPAPGVPPPGRFSLAAIQAKWDKVRSALKEQKHYSVEALLNSGQLLGVEGEVVVLGFEHIFHRDKMGAEVNRQAVEKALSEVMGAQLSVRCVDPMDYQPPPAEVLDADEIKRFAVEELKAQIVETPPSDHD
jgi:DNA polymerase-3 subunit gamma/tau